MLIPPEIPGLGPKLQLEEPRLMAEQPQLAIMVQPQLVLRLLAELLLGRQLALEPQPKVAVLGLRRLIATDRMRRFQSVQPVIHR